MKCRIFSSTDGTSESYRKRLEHLKSIHHSQCIFNRRLLVQSLNLKFRDNGTLFGDFTCTAQHQGYNNMVHGGIIAAIADASMAQCLMGHGIVGYTTELSIKYRKPVLIHRQTLLETLIETHHSSLLYNLQCTMKQNGHQVIIATGRFFKPK
jgi:acyl-coenzyme A thioesterase PaaI-like protein